MPEYLAPGVYVEERSFRAKSIEGVGTSTTAFVGPTLKGPVGLTPELLTSFGDFERIYGGLDDLSYSTNYLAHAVRAYFDNGGSRLYVSRAYAGAAAASDDGYAISHDLFDGTTAGKTFLLKARTPGASGNMEVTLREVAAPAGTKVLASALDGTLARAGGPPAKGAKLLGGKPPFAVPDGGVVRLSVNGGAEASVEFHGASTEAVATDPRPDALNIDAASRTLGVTIDNGPKQAIALPDSASTADLVDQINVLLVGGYARVEGGNLVIGSDTKGLASSVKVDANVSLGFPAGKTAQGGDADNAAKNNVRNLAAVDIGDLKPLVEDATAAAVTVAQDELTSRLVLSTVKATGAAATLEVKNAPAGKKDVHAALGLASGTPAHGVDGVAGADYYVKQGGTWVNSTGESLPTAAQTVDVLTATVAVQDREATVATYDDLAFDPGHPRFLGDVLAKVQRRRADDLEMPLAATVGAKVSAFDLRGALFGHGDAQTVRLLDGDDGGEPGAEAYKAALAPLENLDDISIVAAPGAVDAAIQDALITHVERRRAYRVAVLDAPSGLTPSEARTFRAGIDSTYAALYYPWVVVANPLYRPGQAKIPREITLPPSGFVCGIYARTDVERGVWKAPANEVVRGALRFETDVNFAQQEMLNPQGMNCLRFFPGRGYRVWGARTASSDPEWKYVNVRRYFVYLESSIDRGTQWAVFEPNGDALWANVRETISMFLYNEWVSGALLGTTPQDAFFVRCDRSTMTQADLDNGRLICLVGVAALKPAEFVIFRIGQKTADARQ